MRHPACIFALCLISLAHGQDRLPTMPGYDRYASMRGQIGGSVKRGDVRVVWAEDGTGAFYRWNDKIYRLDLKSKQIAEASEMPSEATQTTGRRGQNRSGPDRGRQFSVVYSPDDKLKAFHRDRNVFLSDKDGGNEIAVTTEGSATDRTKFGIASWVYGEELEVREAMWFSPDSKKLAFYGFEEKNVKDYFLAMDQRKIQDTMDVEPYPKAGAPNPVVSLFIYDLATKQRVKIDAGDPEGIGHYVYAVRWSPDGKELLFNRTNRKQNQMDFCAANPADGKARIVVHEAWPASWTENNPPIQWLEDQRSFIWTSERNGFRNFYLGSIAGTPLKPITQNLFDSAQIVRLDEKNEDFWYTARDGDTPYRLQLHRCTLDGRADRRLTDPKFNHSVAVAPDRKSFSDTYETINTAPVTCLRDASGKQIAELAKSDTSKFESLGLQKVEQFTFTVADGKTKCYGTLKKPSNFDPNKKYPLVVEVYGGPESGSSTERFQLPDPMCEMGFLIAWIDGRGTSSRGKSFKDELYGKLGLVEIDDQAAGVQELDKRPYVDSTRVGICGTSYGGYSSVMAILRHPETFQCAVACSPVTDWRNYDSVYTERYMGLPVASDNEKGYDAGSAMTYARDLNGRLMLYYGTADNNVHPSNSLQLIAALQRAGKSFDVQVGTDQGHSAVNSARQWEYFMDNLVLHR